MAKNYKSSGMEVELVAPANAASGDAVVIGELVLVSVNDAVSGEPAVYGMEGVYDLPLDSATAVAQGDAVDINGSGEVVATTLGSKHCGHAVEAKSAAAGQLVKVKLSRATA